MTCMFFMKMHSQYAYLNSALTNPRIWMAGWDTDKVHSVSNEWNQSMESYTHVCHGKTLQYAQEAAITGHAKLIDITMRLIWQIMPLEHCIIIVWQNTDHA